METPKLCKCGCGNPTNIIKKTQTNRGLKKGEYFSYLPGHNAKEGKSISFESNLKRSLALKGRKRNWTEAHKNNLIKSCSNPHSVERRIALSTSRTGRMPNFSPFIEDLFVRFKRGRWYCNDPRNNSKVTTHARIVYEMLVGVVPEGFHIHHINGKCKDLLDDRPENLLAVPKEWNYRYFPTLAKGFGREEAEITQAYLKFYKNFEGTELFKKVCLDLSEKNYV